MKTCKSKLPKAQLGLITKAVKTAKKAENLRHAKQLGKWIGQGTIGGAGVAYGLKKYSESEKEKYNKKSESEKKSSAKKALPKAQLGIIAKTIKGAAKGAVKGGKSALKAARKESSALKASKPTKTYGEFGQYARASDMRKSDNYRAGRGYTDPIGDADDADRVKLIGMGAGLAGGAAWMAANSKGAKSKKPTTSKKTTKNK